MTNRVWRCGAAEMQLGERTHVMGIVNPTPDSFSDGGVNLDPDTAVNHALRLAADGGDVVDVGGESTRTGSAAVEPGVEMARVLPVVEGIASQGPTVLISIVARRTEVAHEALEA